MGSWRQVDAPTARRLKPVLLPYRVAKTFHRSACDAPALDGSATIGSGLLLAAAQQCSRRSVV